MSKKINHAVSLRKRKVILSFWGCESKSSWTHQSAYLSLRKIFGKVILYDPRKRRLEYGSEKMKDNLLSLIKKTKPEYFLFMPDSYEFTLDFIKQVNVISPKTKTIVHFGDDDLHFSTRSIYYSLFADYCLIGLGQYTPRYRAEGRKNVFPLADAINSEHFLPLNLEKRYDVSFVGTALPFSRVEMMRHLIKNGINVKIFGRGWEKYSDLKENYGGEVDMDEYVRIINQTKINLAPSRSKYGKPHMTGRVFEISACKSFCLCDYHKEFIKNLGEKFSGCLFKNREDLLRKIRYYLENDNERNKIASVAYTKVIENHDMASELNKIFLKISKDDKVFKRKNLPKINGRIIRLGKEDIMKDILDIKSKVGSYDYVCFSSNDSKIHNNRDYLLAYALERTRKKISCCEYNLYRDSIGNYLTFRTVRFLKLFSKRDFCSLLDIKQIMVTKKYFLKNINKFRKAFSGYEMPFINEENTAFIEIPLVDLPMNRKKMKVLNNLDSKIISIAFQPNFVFNLYSLLNRREIIFDPYLYRIILSVLDGNLFFLNYLIGYLKNKKDFLKIKI